MLENRIIEGWACIYWYWLNSCMIIGWLAEKKIMEGKEVQKQRSQGPKRIIYINIKDTNIYEKFYWECHEYG